MAQHLQDAISLPTISLDFESDVMYNMNKIGQLNGKRIQYSTDTEFLIQTRYGKGRYKTVDLCVGDVYTAYATYLQIHVGVGGKKRLYISATNNSILETRF